MKKILFILITLVSVSTYAQFFEISDGDTLDNIANGLNANFDTLESYSNYKDSLYINVKDYGVVDDDDTAYADSLEAVITLAASLGKRVICPGGRYIFDKDVYLTGLTKNDDVEIIGIGEVIFDWTNYVPTGGSGTYAIYLLPDTSSQGSLTSGISAGDSILPLSSVSGLAENDILMLNSNEQWSTIRAEYIKGEFVRIKRISGNNVYTYEPVYDDYQSGTLITYIDAPSFRMENIEIRCHNNNTYQFSGLLLKFFRDVYIDNVRVRGATYRGFGLNYIYNLNIHKCYTNSTLKHGLGYGIGIGSSQIVNVSDNTLLAARHGITLGGTFPIRNFSITGNIVSNSNEYRAGIDTHGDSEYGIISDNVIFNGGINVRSPNTVVEDNSMTLSGSLIGIQFVPEFYPVNSQYNTFKNNHVTYFGDTKGTAVNIAFNYPGDTINNFEISGIKTNANAGIKLYPIYDTSTSCYIGDLTMYNNEISSTDKAFYLDNGINVGRLRIQGGKYVSSDSNAIQIDSTGTSSGSISMLGGVVESYATGLKVNSSFEHIRLRSVDFINKGSGTRYGINLNCDKNIFLSNNYFENSLNDGGIIGSGVDTLYYNYNPKSNCSGTLDDNAGVSYYETGYGNGDVRLLVDTVALYAFGLGSGLVKDTAVFVDNAIIGAYYNSGSDTLHVTSLMCVLAEGTGTETVDVQVSWHATFKSGSATDLNSSAYTVTSITTGDEDTSFDNSAIPPGVWVWGIISSTSTGNKPSLLSVTLSGYKTPTY